MAGLYDNRNTMERTAVTFGFTVAAGAIVYQGGLVALDATGKAVPAGANGKTCVGVACNQATEGETVNVRRGCFAFNNSTGDSALSNVDVNAVCYVADDQSVKKTAGTSPAAPVAGLVMAVDEAGVWVKI